MTPEEFLDAVEREKATELDRLGSSKLLLSLTDADLDAEAVLRLAAGSEAAARDLFAEWAEGAVDDALHDAYVAAADREAGHYERVVAELPDGDVASDGGAVFDYLRGIQNPAERVAAGFVGRALVAVRTQAQLVSFFVNEADELRADMFRDLRAETEGDIDEGLALLDDLCRSEADWRRALDAAAGVVDAAYEEYAASLEAMGVSVKSTC